MDKFVIEKIFSKLLLILQNTRSIKKSCVQKVLSYSLSTVDNV